MPIFVPKSVPKPERTVADEWYQPLPAFPGPQWRLWLNLPAVELWHAIALSCGIEPKYYPGDSDPEFQLRMRVAIGNGLGKGDRPHCSLVLLDSVAQLASKCGWTLPPEFPSPETMPARAETEQTASTERPVHAAAAPVTAGAPLSRQRHQENEILRVLGDLGYDPKRLPRPAAGAAGPKSEVRAQLSWMSIKVFDKAWERLRNSGNISDAG